MISIIIPAFNAENYIEECIESILAQTYTDWELIIVDDGSNDLTPTICDEYAEKNLRIRVIHQENRGVSAARNVGLKKATGIYIAFVDADDILPPRSLEIRINLIGGADLAIAGYELYNENGLIEKMLPCKRKQWDTHDTVRNIIATGEVGYQGFSVNKLFIREILVKNLIRFDEDLTVNEDRLFCVRYALCCSKVHLSDELIYRYRISETNATSAVYKMTDKEIDRFVTEFKSYDRSLELVRDRFPDCFYVGAVEAQYRARVLKAQINGHEKQLISILNTKIRRYGNKALKAPLKTIPLWKKVSIAIHMLLLR